MALIKCKECGKEISDKAKVCPHCGFENNLIICPECKKEIKGNVNTCPNCGYEIQKKNKQVKNKFSIGIKIWLILCVVVCFGYYFLVNYLKIITLPLMTYLIILLGVSYIVLLVNKSKINLYITLGINAVILVYNLFSIGTVISLLNIICVLINAITTFLVVRKSLNNNKLNLFGIISYSVILFVLIISFIIFPHTYIDNNSNGLTDEEQQLFNTITAFIDNNNFYNPSALRIMKLRIEDDGQDYPMLWVRLSGTNKLGGTINKCYKIFYNDNGMGNEVSNDTCDLVFKYLDGNITHESIKKINEALENYW